MKIIGRILYILGILSVLLLICSACQQYDPESDFEVEPIGGTAVKITDYLGSNWTVRIPSKIKNLPITHIDDRAFQRCQLVNVIIPKSVTYIGTRAFSDNQLTNITIPRNVTYIGYMAFSDNPLTKVTIDNYNEEVDYNEVFDWEQSFDLIISNSRNNTSIKDDAFEGMQLTSVVIPRSITNIGAGAFYNNQLTKINIPNSVTRIGGEAFAKNKLTTITIPSNVETLGYGIFIENPITSVTLSGFWKFGDDFIIVGSGFEDAVRGNYSEMRTTWIRSNSNSTNWTRR